jgi:hypothetical protein
VSGGSRLVSTVPGRWFISAASMRATNFQKAGSLTEDEAGRRVDVDVEVLDRHRRRLAGADAPMSRAAKAVAMGLIMISLCEF